MAKGILLRVVDKYFMLGKPKIQKHSNHYHTISGHFSDKLLHDLMFPDFRGFIFTPNVDDAESECDLDSGVNFDYFINNDGNSKTYNSDFQGLLDIINSRLEASKAPR